MHFAITAIVEVGLIGGRLPCGTASGIAERITGWDRRKYSMKLVAKASSMEQKTRLSLGESQGRSRLSSGAGRRS
jgi:hypothetical protein